MVVPLYNIYDDRFGYPGIFHINKCCECGHNFIFGNIVPEMLTILYTDYYPRSSISLEEYRPYHEISGFKAWFEGSFRSAFRWVPENVRVLDIGCGFGETLGYHQARGCEVYGVEADENIRRVADRFGFNVHVGLFDPDLYDPCFFDYVTMDQVIEHMTDPVETLRGVARVLKPEGMAIISAPNVNGWGARLFGRRWINWHAPYHLQHFSGKSMAIAAEKAGLSIERSETITSSDWLHFQWMHLVTLPKMGQPSPFWSLKGNQNVSTRLLLRIISLTHATKINHLITRFFDFLGIGDNFLFILRKNG